MKLKENFITYNKDNQHVMVATEGFWGIVRSNETASMIIEELKKSTTPKKIAKKLSKKYDAPYETIYRDVENIIKQLNEIGAIDE